MNANKLTALTKIALSVAAREQVAEGRRSTATFLTPTLDGLGLDQANMGDPLTFRYAVTGALPRCAAGCGAYVGHDGGCCPCCDGSEHVRLFVYGTLRAGFYNYMRFVRGRATAAERGVRTAEGWAIGANSWARLVPLDLQTTAQRRAAGLATTVLGDVFTLPTHHVRDAIDRLESHPRAWVRGPVTLADGSTVSTYRWSQPGEVDRFSDTGDYAHHAEAL